MKPITNALLVASGLYFYHIAYDFTCAENPQIFSITGLGYGFNIGYGLLIAALASTAVSILPFSFNGLHLRKPKK